MEGSPVLGWSAAAVAGPGVAGGKGWNLGRLARYGFPVPAGFVISAGVYRAFMATAGLKRLSAEIASLGALQVTTADAAQRLQHLRTAIGAAPFPAGLADTVGRALEAAGLAVATVAVRSSATMEDGSAASFAGMHASILNVSGHDAVLRAVREVWASLWTPQAIAYRRRLLVPDSDVACAVVVCRMIDAKAAGVAFTCDPRNGRRDAVSISAGRGPGEGVVSGAVNPEEILVALRENGLVVESRSGPRVLDEEQTIHLSRLALRVMSMLGDCQDPQDIEWTWDGERFHLVQARPVTKVPRRDFPGSEGFPLVWSNANIKDAVPFVMSAMTWSCVLSALRFMMYAYPRAVGYPIPDGIEVVRKFHGRAYFDVTGFQWAMYDAYGSDLDDLSRAMGGHHANLPIPAGRAFRGLKGLKRRLRVLKAARLLLKVPQICTPAIDRVFAQLRELMQVDMGGLTQSQLFELLERISLSQVEFGTPFMYASASLAWQGELEKQINAIAPGRGPGLAASLVAGTGNVVSALQGTRLFDVADAARSDPQAQGWLAKDPFDTAGWKSLPADSPFRREFTRFLEEFGHRSVYEAEIATPRWNEDPSWLIEQVRALHAGSAVRPAVGALEKRALAEAEIRRLTFWRRPGISWLAKRARVGAAMRERAKSALVAQVEPLRRALLEAGRRLVAAGLLDQSADVFNLTWIEVECWLRGEWSGRGARELALDRKAEMRRCEAVRAPDVIVVGGEAAARPVAIRTASGALRGMPVSPGRVTAIARVIRHPADGARLKQGEILVAPSTDPGWTPLFLRASAVVMEVGGMLSHGSIVAREYGLPAVVNVPELLTLVKDGQEITVDGDAGTVLPGK